MILENYVCELPNFFTESEVQKFHTYANTLPVDSGRVGQNTNDDDIDDNIDSNINDSIRRSTVKWFHNDQFSLMHKINEGLNYYGKGLSEEKILEVKTKLVNNVNEVEKRLVEDKINKSLPPELQEYLINNPITRKDK